MYQPLHLKYRPQILSEVIGQQHIVDTLTNAQALHKIAPAYLFAGPKGTGKTSTARILAKSLNCQSTQEPTTQPCGECNSCKGITASSSLDVTELDAASNSGVETIRELISTTQFAPVEGKFKIFIIDECHALSNQSWQALLKTIENPPRHVVFVFCTTEVNKVPETIVSRCQKFDFRRVKLDEVINYLAIVAKSENINISLVAIKAIAKASKGHLRDSLKLLDQASLLNTEEIDPIDPNWIWELSGTIPEYELLTIIENIIRGEIKGNLGILQDWVELGKQPITIHAILVSFLKDLLVCKTYPDGKHLTQLEEDTWSELITISQSWSISQIQSAITLLMSRQNMMRDEAAHLWLSATLIELVPPAPVENTQPWQNWKNQSCAQIWAAEQLPHLTQNEISDLWEKVAPINGKKAPAWVKAINSLKAEVKKA
ncbi:MAG: DNA polymerase III subunit gamma/tau [Scytonematopsis contorta HA4267-MV1]|jgi:DNA polymerase-3 subunit gamma/tau|nr:DNA polymerase III subunit gamma/tau [Scytonematopsis contorta HA4267-MV1]